MAVLAEAYSVLVRKDAIAQKLTGGWEAFVQLVPNATLCSDEEIARVGFMSSEDTRHFVADLERQGLSFVKDGVAQDIAVADQRNGITSPCDWLEFARIRHGESGSVPVCWFYDGPRGEKDGSVYVREELLESFNVAAPDWWKFEGSISETQGYVPRDEKSERLILLRTTEEGLDVYLDLQTGKEVFSAHAFDSEEDDKGS